MDRLWVFLYLSPPLILCALALSAPFWSRRYWPGADMPSRALRLISAFALLLAACLSLTTVARIYGFITPSTEGAVDYFGGIVLFICIIAIIVLREQRRGLAQRRR